MSEENIKLLTAAAIGSIAGLMLGMFLWGGKERKTSLSSYLSSLTDIIRELEEIDTQEAKDLKEKVKNIIGSVEEIVKGKEEKEDSDG